VTPADVERCLHDYVAAVNAHDVPRILARRHPHATLTLMGASPAVDTPDGLERFYRRLFAAAPGYRVTVDGGTYADDVGVMWGSVTDAAAPEPTPEVPAVFVCTFEDGRFRHDRVYADFTRLSALIGPGR
jgi:SnoaL-like domain